MTALAILLEKNDNYAIYSYGYDRDSQDGRIKIPIHNPDGFGVLKESDHEQISKRSTMGIAIKLIKAFKKNEIPELCVWAIG